MDMQNYFTFIEKVGIDCSVINSVLKGDIAGCMLRSSLEQSVASSILSAFNESMLKRCRDDGVPGEYLGTYHYKKDLPHYFSEASKYKKALASVFSHTENVFTNLLQGIVESSNGNIMRHRVANYKGEGACPYFIRKWIGSDKTSYALLPHDDDSQCKDPNQKGFEIQDFAKNSEIIALNICLANEGNSDLVYWDIQPDEKMKKALGVEYTGYPYDDYLLESVEKKVIKVKPLDIYFFNGKNIHAVSAPQGNGSHRVTLSCLMSVYKNELIYWI